MEIFTGYFWWSLQEGNRFSQERTQDTGYYYTTIKGKPNRKDTPDKCWAITNRYDPRLREQALEKH